MCQWSLLLTGIFVSASIVVPTQVKAQKKPVQVQKRPSPNPDVYMKVMSIARSAIHNCYVNKRVYECGRLSNIQSTLRQYCSRGDETACTLMFDVHSIEQSAMMLQSLDSVRF